MYDMNKGAELYNTIKAVCARNGVTVSKMCLDMGMSKAVMSDLIAGRKQTLTSITLGKIAAYLGVSVDSLLDGSAKENAPPEIVGEANSIQLVKFPVIGRVYAGYDGVAIEESTGDAVSFTADVVHGSPENYFVLRVNGNSMYPELKDGDTVLCKRVTSVDSGKMAVIIYNGDEATVKKVRYVYGENWLDLIPINPEYETKHIEGRDVELCRVVGEVVSMQRKF